MMNTFVEELYRAQSALPTARWESEEAKTALATLRESVPPPILAHFLRIMSTGRRGVALVRHNVCGECHLRLPAGTQELVERSDDLHVCENCGAYLRADPAETGIPGTGLASSAPHRRRARRVAAAR